MSPAILPCSYCFLLVKFLWGRDGGKLPFWISYVRVGLLCCVFSPSYSPGCLKFGPELKAIKEDVVWSKFPQRGKFKTLFYIIIYIFTNIISIYTGEEHFWSQETAGCWRLSEFSYHSWDDCVAGLKGPLLKEVQFCWPNTPSNSVTYGVCWWCWHRLPF